MSSSLILPWTRYRRWPVAGFLLGLLFPLMGTGIEIARRSLPFTPDTLIRLQFQTPLLWVIDLAPFILMLVGWFVLTPQGNLALTTRRARFLPVALTLLATLPVGLLIYALGREAIHTRMVSDATDGASLRYRSMWMYGATRNTESIPAKDRAQTNTVVNQMAALRERLRRHYPSQVARTDTAWQAFAREFKQTRMVSWATANRLRAVGSELMVEIEGLATQERSRTLRVLSFGMVAVALSLVIGLGLLRQLRHAEAVVQGDRDFINAILNTAQSVIVVTDPKGKIVRFNHAAERLTGYSAAEVTGKHYSFFLTAEEKDAVIAAVKNIKADDYSQTLENQWVTKSGEKRLLSWSSTALVDENGGVRFLIGTAVDITEQRVQEKRLASLATTDGLTGVANRRAFDERLALEVTRANRYNQSLSLVVLDIDRFKPFNDTFGHPAGDEVLRQVAVLLAGTARETDFVARYGGEEFVIILPVTDYADSLAQAERYRTALEVAHWPHREITGSFGVSTWSAALTTGDELIAEADRALYQAKKTRNAVRHAENRYTMTPETELLSAG